jgi:hypothetical protein
VIRGKKVMLDEDLANLYGVETKALVRQVKRNSERFPEDFMFQLSKDEAGALRCQFGTSNSDRAGGGPALRSQSATSNGRGGRRYLPYAFTEQGVAMLSSVLRSTRAVAVNIEIMRTFVALREVIASNADLARRLENLERKYGVHDARILEIFEAIRQLMLPPVKEKHPLGFAPNRTDR